MFLFVTSPAKRKRIQGCSCHGISIAEIVCLTSAGLICPPKLLLLHLSPPCPMLCLAGGSPNIPKHRPRFYKAEVAWKHRQVFVPASPSAAPQGALGGQRSRGCWLTAVLSVLGCRRAKQWGRGTKTGYQCVHFYDVTPNDNRSWQRKIKEQTDIQGAACFPARSWLPPLCSSNSFKVVGKRSCEN